MEDLRRQEPIGFNTKEKERIRLMVKAVNKTAQEGSKKTTFSSFIREAALQRVAVLESQLK